MKNSKDFNKIPLYFQLKKILHFIQESMKKRQNTYIEVYGSIQIDRWLKLIGFSNIHHLSKLRCLDGSGSRA